MSNRRCTRSFTRAKAEEVVEVVVVAVGLVQVCRREVTEDRWAVRHTSLRHRWWWPKDQQNASHKHCRSFDVHYHLKVVLLLSLRYQVIICCWLADLIYYHHNETWSEEEIKQSLLIIFLFLFFVQNNFVFEFTHKQTPTYYIKKCIIWNNLPRLSLLLSTRVQKLIESGKCVSDSKKVWACDRLCTKNSFPLGRK